MLRAQIVASDGTGAIRTYDTAGISFTGCTTKWKGWSGSFAECEAPNPDYPRTAIIFSGVFRLQRVRVPVACLEVNHTTLTAANIDVDADSDEPITEELMIEPQRVAAMHCQPEQDDHGLIERCEYSEKETPEARLLAFEVYMQNYFTNQGLNEATWVLS